MIFVGKKAPDFTSTAVMADNQIKDDFNLRKYSEGSKVMVVFYPLDFTFVCPSEIIAFNNRANEFIEKNCKLVLVSIDSHFSHIAWKNTPVTNGGIGGIKVPMISDINKKIASMYGVLNDDGVSMRGSFLIDEEFTLRHFLVNDLPIGRSTSEALRVVDALSFHQKHGEVCPAGWQEGSEGIVPTADGIAHYLTSNSEKL